MCFFAACTLLKESPSFMDTLRRLPLHDFHVAHGAHMAPFAGTSMPVHYGLGILGEHRHTRSAAGLFDVSHMGQIAVRARDGCHADTAHALERLIPADLLSLPEGRQQYSLLTNETGGIRDDLMIANFGSFFYLVVNATTAADDFAYLSAQLSATFIVESLAHRALLAIQGPGACAALSSWLPSVAALRFMDARRVSIEGAECFVTRSGYTGEDGFELSMPAAAAASLAARLVSDPTVRLIGLGARDSLRLEAGLCLYGHDLDSATTPVEAALEWTIGAVRRPGGTRSGGFPGATVIATQLANGPPRRRVGLRAELRPVRAGTNLFIDPAATDPLGRITSGTYGPSLEAPVAMGYVSGTAATLGTRLFAEVRGQRIPVTVSSMPFVAHRYNR